MIQTSNIRLRMNIKLKEKKWNEIIDIYQEEFPKNKNLLTEKFIRNTYIKALINIGDTNKVKEIINELEIKNDLDWLANIYIQIMDFEKAIDTSKKNIILSLRSFIKTQLRNISILSARGENILEYKSLLLPAYHYLYQNDKTFFEKNDPNGFSFEGIVETVPYITLIVSGGARSGTTALGDILNLSEDICLFKERYSPRFGYHPKMFEKKFIYSNLLMPHYDQYKDLEIKYNQSPIYIGDKRPGFPLSKDITLQNYKPEQIKIVHIIRNIYDISFSYKMRAINASKGLDASWTGSRGVIAACEELNIINQKIIEILEDNKFKNSIYIVEYEHFFINKSSILNLFNWLDINIDMEMDRQIEEMIDKAKQLTKKERILTEKEREDINQLFDFDTYNKLLEQVTIF